MRKLRHVPLALVMAAGLLTLLASSLEEEDIILPPVPVTVEYRLETPTSFKREQDSRDGTVTALVLTGDYRNANSGDGLSLNRTVVRLDTGGSFTLAIDATGNEMLEGTSEIDISSTLDFSLQRNPTGGGFESLFGNTRTIVEVLSSSNVNVIVGDDDGLPLTWSAFVASEGEPADDLNVRMASAAYNMLSSILRAVLVIEDIVSDIETESSMLESMGSGTLLTLECENRSTDEGDPPSASLKWIDDTTGAGQGDVGIDDSFEAFYTNCRDSVRNRFLDGRVELSDYLPDRGSGLRRLGVSAGLFDLFNSVDAVTEGITEPTVESPRYTGELTLDYREMDQMP